MKRRWGWLAAIALLAGGQAQAQDCPGLKLVTRVQLESEGDSGRQLVPVTINGSPRKMLLDTGGFTSQLSRNAMTALGLHDQQSRLRLYDVTGNNANRFVTVDELLLGTIRATRLQMPVIPDPEFHLDGILAGNLLYGYDVDIDFGTGVMNYFSPDHCPGKVLYWSAPAVAVVPITIRDKSDIVVPVMVDDRKFNAIIDTGSSGTVMSLPVAKRQFGLTPESPGVTAYKGVNNDKDLAVYEYVFKTLTFGGITVNNAHVMLLPDVVNRKGDNREQTGNRSLTVDADMKLADLLVGMNVLKKLHVYMAFKERRFYVTPASQTVAQPATAQSPAAQRPAAAETRP
jgi:predicted aspartyl protease